MRKIPIPQALFILLIRYFFFGQEETAAEIKRGLEERLGTLAKMEAYRRHRAAANRAAGKKPRGEHQGG